MSLIDNFRTPCVMRIKTSTPDGEGGSHVSWADGAAFTPAIVKDKDVDTVVADREQASCTYTVTVDKTHDIPYHSVFKCISDGKLFRVVSDQEDTQSPDCATFSLKQVTAIEWEEA